jgi:hypothetical protein
MINTPVECGNPQLTKITSSSGRSISKDWLRPINREGKVYCAWCNQKELTRVRSKYCSKACLETSSAYCYPQKNAQSFYFLFIRQNNQCANCKFDYSSALEALKKEKLKSAKIRIKKKIELLKELSLEEAAGFKKKIQGEIKKFKKSVLTPYIFDMYTPKKIRRHHRQLKDHREPEVDHLVPIGAGGSALGFENLQLLCFKCHKVKTSQDQTHIREFKRLKSS